MVSLTWLVAAAYPNSCNEFIFVNLLRNIDKVFIFALSFTKRHTMQFTFQHTAELEFPDNQFIEVELTITAEYTPASRGSRGSHGEPEEPDEDSSIEILSCVDKAGNEYPADDVPGVMNAAIDYLDNISE